MKVRNVVIGLVLCIFLINIVIALTIFVVSAVPIKQFDAQQKKLTLTDSSGNELQIKVVSIKEGVCKFEEVFEVTAINGNYVPKKNKDFKLSFKNKKQEDAAGKISSEEWFVWEDNTWKILEWKKIKPIKKGETKRYKVVVTKQAELGDKQILTVPSFMGIEDERLSWWNVSWQYKINSTLNNVPSGGQEYNLTIHSGIGANNQTDVFLNGHNATNFSDIRFVLDDITELNYWIEDNSTDPIKVWVKVPINGTVYMYYGNNEVKTTSNGFSTFYTFFDDFEDNNVDDWTCDVVDYRCDHAHCVITDGYKSKYSYKAATKSAGPTPNCVVTLNRTINLPLNWKYEISCVIKAYTSWHQYAHNYFNINTETLWSGDTKDWFKDNYNISTWAGNNTNLKFITIITADGNSAYIQTDSIFIHRWKETKVWQTWSVPETELYPDVSITQYNSQRKLVRTSDGYLHRVYTEFDGSNYRVWYAKSTDDGSTWTKTVLTDAGEDNKNPAIASNSEDNLWVVYESPDGIKYRKNPGLNWETEQSIGSTDYDSIPVIAIDSDDNVHVAWYIDYSGLQWLRYRKYNGTSWCPIENIRESNYPEYPSITVDINNYVHIVWHEKNSTTNTQNIKHRKKTDTWQSIYDITTGETYDQTHPCIATDISGNAHIVWQTEDHQIRSIKYKSDGSWEGVRTVCDGGIYEQRNPSISVYSNNYVYATWYGKSATYHDNYIIRESHKTTGSWSGATDILHPTGKDVVYPNLISALYPKICANCYINIPGTGYAFVYEEAGAIKYHKFTDLAWKCPNKYVLIIKAVNTKTGADVTSFSADIGTGETKTTSTGIIKFRCLDTGYYSLKIIATGYYTYIENIVVDATKEMTVPLTPITEADYFLPKVKPVTFTVQNAWGTIKFEDVQVEAVGYNITHPHRWLGTIFGFTNETEIYNTTMNGTTDSEGQIVFQMLPSIKYRVTFVKESAGINKTWFKYPSEDKYTIIIWNWEYPEEGTEEILETALNITTSTINDTHAQIHIHYNDSSDLTNSLNINITRLTSFNREEGVVDYTVTNQSIVNKSFIVTPYQGRSFTVKIIALHEKWGEKIWEYGIKFKGLLSDLELPNKIYPIIAIALLFFIGGFFGATTALQGSLIVSIVGWIFYGIGWLSLASDVVMISALSLATVMSVLALMMERARKTGVQ